METQNYKGSLLTTIKNSIATIEFGHPAGNSFPHELLEKFTNELNSLSENHAISVIVIKSSCSGAFCGGAAFEELLAVSNQEEGTKFFSGFAHLIYAMRNCSKIIIGRIQGKAVGGGIGIIAACDYALATHESAIKLSEIAIGIGPFVIEPALTRKIGKSAMSEIALTPHEWKTATWANQKGLYAKVFDTQNELDAEVEAFSNTLSQYNPEALFEMKKVFWEGTENWKDLLFERAKISGKLVLSDFAKNALAQFKK